MFYLTIVNKTYVTVTLGWHDSIILHWIVFNSLPHGKFFMLFCRLLIFFKINFFEQIFREYHLTVKQFGSRSGPTFCCPDQDPICLQRLSADDTRRQRVNWLPKQPYQGLRYEIIHIIYFDAYCQSSAKMHYLFTCRLLIIFANSLDPDQARQEASLELGPNCGSL